MTRPTASSAGKLSGPSSALKRRERNKSDKLRRIKAAARELFLTRRYDEATMREIARRAEVGLGTLFSYASDKRDLLFVIYNDELQSVTQAGFHGAARGKGFLSNIVAAFSGYYSLFAREPGFMRHVLREITFYSSGHEAPRIRRGRETIISGLVALISDAKRRGQVVSSAKDEAIAEVIFAIYQAEVRHWLTDARPRPVDGLRRLRRALRILCEGLKAVPRS